MDLGICQHWKGNRYVALFLARDSNNDANREDVVVCLSLSEGYAGSVHVRRVTEFLEEVDAPGGGKVQRFTYVGPVIFE
jgi:hypothetical protein